MKFICLIIFIILQSIAIPFTNAQSKISQTTIKGVISDELVYDSITVMVHGEFVDDNRYERYCDTIVKVLPKRGKFFIALPSVKHISYFSLWLSSKRSGTFNEMTLPYLKKYLIEPADSLSFYFMEKETQCSGSGNEKNQCLQQMESSGDHYMMTAISNLAPGIEPYFGVLDSMLSIKLDILNNYKNKIRADVYDIMKVDLYADYGLLNLRYLNNVGIKYESSSRLDAINDKISAIQLIKESEKLSSRSYTNYLFMKAKYDYKLPTNTSGVDIYTYTKEKQSGTLQQKLILSTLLYVVSQSALRMPEYYFKDALEVVQEDRYRIAVNKLYDTYGTGKKVSDFSFKDTLNNVAHLSDFEGKTVIIDLWFTGCTACVYVNRSLHQIADTFKNDKIVFLSISIDRNKSVWMESIRENATPSKLYPMAGKYATRKGTINLYTAGKGEEDCFISRYSAGGSYPQLLIIDASGNMITSRPPRPDENTAGFISVVRNALSKSN